MAKKRITLPKDFQELLKKGTPEELKAVFEKCEPDARGGYGKQTALAFDECPHELAAWLVEQGADLQAFDTWKNTPLHNRSRSVFGNIQSLLELGADVNATGSSVGTPLHAAADSHNVKNTELLLAHGAKPDVQNSRGLIPLEQALLTCNNIDIERTLQLAQIYLKNGIRITPKMKEFVTEIGKRFEFHRGGFNKDSVDQVSEALKELYRVFDVEPVAQRLLHDGKNQITVKAQTWQKQHQELWDLLVPSSGHAQTVQGEVVRITGRIAHELEGNGGINWDNDFKKMAETFQTFVQMGKPLHEKELKEVGEIVSEIKRRYGNTSRMAELGVSWVLQNPEPIAIPSLDYTR